MPITSRSRAGRTVAAVTGLTAFASMSLATLATAPAQADQPSPIVLAMPDTISAYSNGSFAYTDGAAPTVQAGENPFVVKLRRAAWDQPIVATWAQPGGDVTLPDGLVDQFGDGGLPNFFRQVVRGPKGHKFYSQDTSFCADGSTERATPDAPAHSLYPTNCPWNRFTKGQIIGVQAGWYAQPWSGIEMRLKPGTYTLNTSIAPKYRAMFGISAADGFKSSKLVVTKDVRGFRTAKNNAKHHAVTRPAAKPNKVRPTGAVTSDWTGPSPDLVSLPAFGMAISPKGNYLQFAATVYNAGTSPLVVDGFRTQPGLMDAYQYFFDTNGNQVGYVPAGTMEWDARPSHNHWHFSDFAKYELLDADGKFVERSEKEAFCLANTDAVDYLLPDANWHPDGSDLSTACGDYNARSVRESLQVGSGDTYSQSRAGQSFNLKGLPNGTYYVAVTANPDGTLTESDTTNNTALRKITIGGKLGARTVQMEQVGLVVDASPFWK